ncbi:MAG: hypothetical protein B6240_11585 [Desulfobacteraceae bacterium 4572_87]|nr:MAG: hypothetical protein B6240_11585 [Desulfobacteraceae bacterium 4572_87]
MVDMEMAVTEENDSDVNIIAIKGRLDAGSSKRVLAGIKELLKRNRLKIILDMSGVAFIDSVGLGILLTSYRAVDAKGGALAGPGLYGGSGTKSRRNPRRLKSLRYCRLGGGEGVCSGFEAGCDLELCGIHQGGRL